MKNNHHITRCWSDKEVGGLGRRVAIFFWEDLSDRGSEQRPEQSEGGSQANTWCSGPELAKALRLRFG